MVGDLFHMGHVQVLKAARDFGDWLIVGVISDEIAFAYKHQLPIMTLAERVAVIEACRYVDEVMPNAPYTVTTEFLDEHDISVVVHGDDISQETIEEVYGSVAASGKLRIVRYTTGISTEDLIRRARGRAGHLSDGTQLPLEGPDWVTWNPNTDSRPNLHGRLYGNEHTIRTIIEVLAQYRKTYPNAPRVVVGDISLHHGGVMDQHLSHQNGLDVDIYYPRRDGWLQAPTSTSQIDRRLAQHLLDGFVAAGASTIFVGYSTDLRGPHDIVFPYPNHDDHMHVRFRNPD
jgi:cytidyltransferase-like protein